MKVKVENRPVILITGSAGLIGARLAEAFSSEYQVIGMDVKRPERNATGADWVECDLTNQRSGAARREKTAQSSDRTKWLFINGG